MSTVVAAPADNFCAISAINSSYLWEETRTLFHVEKSTCHGTLDPVALSFQSYFFSFVLGKKLSCKNLDSEA